MGYNAGSYDVIVIGAGHAGCEVGSCGSTNGLKNINVNN